MPTHERPLGPLQRNWLRFLEANPGPHYADLSLRQLAVLEGLQRRGLVTLADNGTRTPKGRTVYRMQALQREQRDLYLQSTMQTLSITHQEARLLVLVLERAQKSWFKPENELPIHDELFHLYEKLHLFSDTNRRQATQ